MLLFMLITFGLFWVVIKNNLLYCVRTGTVDGGGLFFPSAINQLFTGLYFMEFCLIGLFFLARDTKGKVACAPQGIIMAVVLAMTILYQIWLMNHLAPLFKYASVRLDVESKGLLAEYEEKHRVRSQELRDSLEATKTPPEAEDKEEDPLDLSTLTTTQDLVIETLQSTESSTPERPPLRERQSSHRSKNLQAQKQADQASAQRILHRLNQPLNEARLAHLENKLAPSSPSSPTSPPTNTHTNTNTTRPTGLGLLPRRKDIEAQMNSDPISKIIMQHNDELSNLDPEERDMLISVAFTHPVLRETRPCVWIPQDGLGVSDDEVRRMRSLSGHVVVDNRGAFFDARGRVRVVAPPPDMSEFKLIMDEL